jgi:hypothetical protein
VQYLPAVYTPALPTVTIEPTAIGSPAVSATTHTVTATMHAGILTVSTCIRTGIGADAGFAAEAPKAFPAHTVGKLVGSSVLSASLPAAPPALVALASRNLAMHWAQWLANAYFLSTARSDGASQAL